MLTEPPRNERHEILKTLKREMDRHSLCASSKQINFWNARLSNLNEDHPHSLEGATGFLDQNPSQVGLLTRLLVKHCGETISSLFCT